MANPRRYRTRSGKQYWVSSDGWTPVDDSDDPPLEGISWVITGIAYFAVSSALFNTNWIVGIPAALLAIYLDLRAPLWLKLPWRCVFWAAFFWWCLHR